MLIDSVFRTKESYYPQVFLEEYEYVVKENKMCIDEEIEISSDESDEQVSDVEASDEEASDEEQVEYYDVHSVILFYSIYLFILDK